MSIRTVYKRPMVSVVCTCAVLIFFFNGAQTAASNFSSVISSDGQAADDSSQTTVEKGMKPFFDMVKSFLGVIQPHKITERSWLNLSALVTDGKFQSETLNDWQHWAQYLVGFTVCVAIGLAFLVIMPIIGFVFCICRCCGKCGGRPKSHDPKHAGCKRKSYCTSLLLLNTVVLAGVVCAFVSNQVVYEKLTNVNNGGPVGKLTSILHSFGNYINGTVNEMEATILTSFDSAKIEIIAQIRTVANKSVDNVLSTLNATSLLVQTRNLSEDVNRTRDALDNIASKLDLLSSLGSNLTDNLIHIANGVESLSKRPEALTFGNFNKSSYGVGVNFSMLDRLSSEASDVSRSLDMNKYIQEAEQKIANVKISATQNVDKEINEASDKVNDIRTTIQSRITDVRGNVHSVIQFTSEVSQNMLSAQDGISKYSQFVWYGGLAVSSLLLLIVVLYYMGVLFGLCGERPGFGAQCCNTGVGSNFLMAGVGFTFIFSCWLMAVCMILFVLGGSLYTEVCRYFVGHQPSELQPFSEALSQAANFQTRLFYGKDIELSVVTILNDCSANRPIYSVMKLDNMVNLTTITSLEPLRIKLTALQNTTFNIPNITIVTKELNTTVTNFATSGIDGINFTAYYEQVNKDLTFASLEDLSRNLAAIANMQVDQPIKDELTRYAKQLHELHDTSVQNMKSAVASLNASLNFLQQQSDIKVKAKALMDGLESAQVNFNTMKQTLLVNELDLVIKGVLAFTQAAIDDVLWKVQNEIGLCRPVFDSFYSASDAVCIVVLDPLNGFWFSIGWCLFFFVPCLIFAVKLAGLYRREHEKAYDHPNYHRYDSSNQDTMPLTSVDRGHRYGYPGMANSAYGQDSYSRPAAKYAPPPYGVSQYGLGSGEMTPPPYTHALRESPLHYDLAQRLSQVHNRGPPKPSTQTHNLGPPKPSAPFY